MLRISSASVLAILFCFLSCRSSLCSKKPPVLESLFNKVAGEVYKNTFFYRIPPVAVFVVFATKQPNIQCYNDNFGLYYNQRLSWKYFNQHPPYIKTSIYYQKDAHLDQRFCSLSNLLLSKLVDPLKHLFLHNSNIFEGERWCFPQLYSVTRSQKNRLPHLPRGELTAESEMFLKLFPEAIHLKFIMLIKTSAIQSGL